MTDTGSDEEFHIFEMQLDVARKLVVAARAVNWDLERTLQETGDEMDRSGIPRPVTDAYLELVTTIWEVIDAH